MISAFCLNLSIACLIFFSLIPMSFFKAKAIKLYSFSSDVYNIPGASVLIVTTESSSLNKEHVGNSEYLLK